MTRIELLASIRPGCLQYRFSEIGRFARKLLFFPLTEPHIMRTFSLICPVNANLANGRRFRVLNLVGDYSGDIVLRVIDLSIPGHRFARELDWLERKLSKIIVYDNGPEITCNAILFRPKKTGTKLHSLQSDKPTQNTVVESFNAKFSNYCLVLHWFALLTDAQSFSKYWLPPQATSFTWENVTSDVAERVAQYH